MTITINGRQYEPTERVEWEDAEAAGGFYYTRARYLKLPRPKAVLFDYAHRGYIVESTEYHILFRDAEIAIPAVDRGRSS